MPSVPHKPSGEQVTAGEQRMTKGEREDLHRLVRQRERVLTSGAKQRSAELKLVWPRAIEPRGRPKKQKVQPVPFRKYVTDDFAFWHPRAQRRRRQAGGLPVRAANIEGDRGPVQQRVATSPAARNFRKGWGQGRVGRTSKLTDVNVVARARADPTFAADFIGSRKGGTV